MKFISGKQFIKIFLFFLAVVIGTSSLLYTYNLVKLLSDEERKRVELWAEATREIQEVDLDGQISLIVYKMIQENKTIPVILVNSQGNMTAANLDSALSKNKKYLEEQLSDMQADREPIIINYIDGTKDFIYYKNSVLLTQLQYYPFVQFGVIALFILVSYFALRSSQKADENQLWVGMSKETAHQLGTPISSLLAWVELLKLKEDGKGSRMVEEVEKDIKRLETVTERFSKIGAKPVLNLANILQVLDNSINYLRTRTSSRVTYIKDFPKEMNIQLPMNIALFEWVIENLCKNAIDAMTSADAGSITISVTQTINTVIIDVKDTGKGIQKSKFKTIFQAGYTTKKRGWGLGLSLTKRIIETYHKGKIFVKNSELDKGTTFRIILNK